MRAQGSGLPAVFLDSLEEEEGILFKGVVNSGILYDVPFGASQEPRLDILDSVLNLISFSAILWATSQTLTGALAVYVAWTEHALHPIST